MGLKRIVSASVDLFKSGIHAFMFLFRFLVAFPVLLAVYATGMLAGYLVLTFRIGFEDAIKRIEEWSTNG